MWSQAYHWLQTKWEAAPTAPEQVLQLFLTARLCEKQGVAGDLTTEITPYFYTDNGDMNPLLHEADPYLFLLALANLDNLLPFQPYLQEIETSINQILAEPDPCPPSVLIVLWALRQIYPGKYTLKAAQPKMSPLYLDGLYDFTDEALQELAHYIAAQTAFGIEKAAFTESNQLLLGECLPPIALACLRDYKLDLGCELLNAIHYLQLNNTIADQAIPFLRLQQQSNGSFGFLSIEGHHRLIKREADLDIEVYLPATLTCLRTLALYTEPAK